MTVGAVATVIRVRDSQVDGVVDTEACDKKINRREDASAHKHTASSQNQGSEHARVVVWS